MITLDPIAARRFVLGRQGLWPGRRWRGLEGAASAMRAVEYLQLDPLNVVARSHDLMLHARVLEYQPDHFDELTYRRREFFDWGNWLAVRPMGELPYWRVLMEKAALRRRALPDGEWNEVASAVRAALRERGPLGNRDFEGNKVAGFYRGRKDTALVLFDMWIAGEIMTHSRRGFERVYDFREAVAPRAFGHVASEEEAILHLARKEIAFLGLAPAGKPPIAFRSATASEVARLHERLEERGFLHRIQVEGRRGARYISAEDLPLVSELAAGRVPAPWTPLGPDTREEVLFLAPLDPVSARGRAKEVFGREYVWEVYKAEHLRSFGYYTLPVIWGEEFVARVDPKFDRTTRTLVFLGVWLESPAWAKETAFLEALRRGALRLARFLGAERMKVGGPAPSPAKRALTCARVQNG